ncbi:MAG: ATP-binding protein [Candidatus Omnitrophica bacterium]|nr:ATP-binding protein [Candidatus Omnitrophota bacterium]
MDKTFHLEANAQELKPFRAALRQLLEHAGFDEKMIQETILAVDECLTNVIRHAYGSKPGKIEVRVQDTPHEVRFSIKDFGHKFDPTQLPEPKLPPEKPGGLGVFLTRQLMDLVEYDPHFREGNLIHLIKYKTNQR